jgi:predicted transglutaminase-like cysteine proteinase
MPNQQTNGISRSALKMKSLNQTPEDNEEINGILGMISDKGELVLKNKKIQVIPHAFYYTRFDKIQILDI